MKDEDEMAITRGQRLEGGIRTAVELWCRDPAETGVESARRAGCRCCCCGDSG